MSKLNWVHEWQADKHSGSMPVNVLVHVLASLVLRKRIPAKDQCSYQAVVDIHAGMLGVNHIAHPTVSDFAHSLHVCTNCKAVTRLSSPQYNVYQDWCPSCCPDHNSIVERSNSIKFKDSWFIIRYYPLQIQEKVHNIVLDKLTNL